MEPRRSVMMQEDVGVASAVPVPPVARQELACELCSRSSKAMKWLVRGGRMRDVSSSKIKTRT